MSAELITVCELHELSMVYYHSGEDALVIELMSGKSYVLDGHLYFKNGIVETEFKPKEYQK